MNIKEITKEIHEVTKGKGFWDNTSVVEKLMLTVSELSEAMEADRKDRRAEMENFYMRLKGMSQEEYDEYFPSAFEDHVKNSFEDELADTAIRLFDMAAGFGVDLEKHIRLKVDYNKTRPQKHGVKY